MRRFALRNASPALRSSRVVEARVMARLHGVVSVVLRFGRDSVELTKLARLGEPAHSPLSENRLVLICSSVCIAIPSCLAIDGSWRFRSGSAKALERETTVGGRASRQRPVDIPSRYRCACAMKLQRTSLAMRDTLTARSIRRSPDATDGAVRANIERPGRHRLRHAGHRSGSVCAHPRLGRFPSARRSAASGRSRPSAAAPCRA